MTARIAIASQRSVKWAPSFSSGDAALAERSRRHEVKAAASRLSGEGRGQRQDRPDGRSEGEDRAVLEGDVAAQRADLRADQLDVAEQAHHRRGDAPEERADLEPGRGRREDGRHGDAHHERHPAEQAGRDDERESRVADRLAVDGAEAVELAAERDGRECRSPVGARRLGGHVKPPPRRHGRTGRGTSPRGSAPARRSRAARSGPPPGPPA